MFIKCCTRYIRSSDIPDADAEIDQQSTAGDLMFTLGTPTNSRDRSYGLYTVQISNSLVVLCVPNLEQKESKNAKLGQPIMGGGQWGPRFPRTE